MYHNVPVRRRTILPALLLTLPLAVAACAAPLDSLPASGTARMLALTDRGLEDVVRETFRETGALGVVVAVVVGDSVVMLQPFMGGSMAALPPLDTGDLFPAGAVMPMVNALAALRAEEAGVVDLDRPVGEYVPELTDTLHQATLAQLLTHRAGLVMRPALAGQRGDDLDAAPRQLTYIDRLAPPGAIHSRSPAGIALAGWILQQEDGREYGSLVEETVLQPLGMESSTIGFPGAGSIVQGFEENETAGARYRAAELEPDSALGLPIHGLYATPPDLALLVRALLNDGVVAGEQRIPAERVREALRPRARVPGLGGGQIALGGEIDEWEGRRRLSLMSRTAAHSVALRLLPDDSIGVVVLANTPILATARIADEVFRHTLDIPAPGRRPGSRPADTAGPEPLHAEELAGVYANGGEGLELIVEGGSLRLRSGDLSLAVEPSNGRYRALLPDGRPALTFEIVRDDAGRPYIWLGDRALARHADR